MFSIRPDIYDTNQNIKNIFNNVFNFINFLFINIFGFTTLLVLSLGNSMFVCWDYIMEKSNRKHIIYDPKTDEPYLIRYYLLFKDRDKDSNINFPFNIFVHKFLKSDTEEMHDHPWSYFTFLLSGGYYEYVNDPDINTIIRYNRKPYFFKKFNETHTHRVELKKDCNGNEIPCWSLFIAMRKKQSWGFYEEIDNELVWKKAEEYKSQFKNKDNIVKCEVEIKQYLEKTVGTDDEDFDEKPENVTENNSGFFNYFFGTYNNSVEDKDLSFDSKYETNEIDNELNKFNDKIIDVNNSDKNAEHVNTEHANTEHANTEHANTENTNTEDTNTEDTNTEDTNTEDTNTEDTNIEYNKKNN